MRRSCELTDLPRSSYYRLKNVNKKDKQKTKRHDAKALERIKELRDKHPFWGYRHIHTWLNRRESLKIGKNRVLRIMRENSLLVPQKRYRAKRAITTSKPKAQYPNQYWGIDMTKFLVGPSWVYLVVVIDWDTKKVVGWDLALRSKAADWLRALENAILSEFPQGVRDKGLKLISDNGCQPTATSFQDKCSALDIQQIFTSYNNPKGNADTERIMRTIKEEVVWINDIDSYLQASSLLSSWFSQDYNNLWCHSSLGGLSPFEFENQFYSRLLKEAA